MIALDTNILVYAHRRESRFHVRAKTLVRDLAEGSTAWSIPWPCVYEFFSVVTNPRIWQSDATPPSVATDQVRAWAHAPTLRLLSEPNGFFQSLQPIIDQPRIRGPVVHDARIAALCIAHGVDELLSKDRDFQHFPTLRVRDPFA